MSGSSFLRRSRLSCAAAGTVVAAAVLLASPAAMATSASPLPAASVQPHGSIDPGTRFYVDPNTQVMRWDAANPSDSREPVIASKIASQPQAVWFSSWDPTTVTSDVQAVTGAAATAGQTPVLVIYEIPNRDCGGASAGGAPDIPAYDAYIQDFSKGLGTGQVVIILEPDSVALQSCLSASDVTARDGALAQAVTTLKGADPNAKVYMDAGHSAWNAASDQASRLAAAGVAKSDGIFSNVSNYMTTSDEVSYDKSVLSALDDPSSLHIVVDTSRNGAGPAPGDPWCDPSGRAIGVNPTASTGDPQVDAYLWVKPPGEADGCADAAGVFDPALAYALATNPGAGGGASAG